MNQLTKGLLFLENKMLVALTKCEESSNIDPPEPDILFASNLDTSTVNIEEGVDRKKTRNMKTKSILTEDNASQENNHRASVSLYGSSATTAVPCMSSFSGSPRFSIDIDQKLSGNRLIIMKKKLEFQNLQRRLTYLAEYYYRELLGTISWAKNLPGRMTF